MVEVRKRAIKEDNPFKEGDFALAMETAHLEKGYLYKVHAVCGLGNIPDLEGKLIYVINHKGKAEGPYYHTRFKFASHYKTKLAELL